jgi:hypothetical protein
VRCRDHLAPELAVHEAPGGRCGNGRITPMPAEDSCAVLTRWSRVPKTVPAIVARVRSGGFNPGGRRGGGGEAKKELLSAMEAPSRDDSSRQLYGSVASNGPAK